MIDLEYEPKPGRVGPWSPLRQAVWVVAVLYVGTAGVVLIDEVNPGACGVAVTCLAMQAAPFVLLAGYAARFARRARAVACALAATVACAALGWVVLVDAFYIHLDAQSAIVLVALPGLHLLLAGAGLGAAVALDAR